jgi:hypothetical protein
MRRIEGVTSALQLVPDIRRFEISSRLTTEAEIGCKPMGGGQRPYGH